MAITAKMVKELREKTGAGMMDCKKALTETDGNMDEAIDVLRKSGAAKAAKKAERIAGEGTSFIKTARKKQTVTDKKQTLTENINSVVAKIGEKITLRRFALLSKTDADAFGAYLHMGGRIGALTVLEGTTDEDVAKDIAMHVAAVNPSYI